MTVAWGLVGTARVNRRIIPALRASRRARLVAVASREEGRARAYAREWDIPRAHAGYEALLHDPEIDAVYLPLPNALHVEWTLRALDAGKHVLCEKPLALAAEDVDRIAALAQAGGRIVAEAFMYRHEPLTTWLLEALRTERFGTLRTISSGFTYMQNREADVRLVPELGGGSLWDVGCYSVSIARLMAGTEPLEVFGWSTRAASGIDDSFTALLRFPGEVVAVVHSGFRTAYRTWLEVTGSGQVIRVSNPFKPGLREDVEIREGDEIHRLEVEGSTLHFVRLVEDFAAAVLDGRPQTVTLSESRGNAATLAALYESAGRGVPIHVRPASVRMPSSA